MAYRRKTHGNGNDRGRLSLLVLSGAAVLSGSALGADPVTDNSTIAALLAEGVALSVARTEGPSYQIVFMKDGRYEATTGAAGRWIASGETLCFLRDEESDHDGLGGTLNCGELSDGKVLGDVWVAPSKAGGDVTLSIVKTAD